MVCTLTTSSSKCISGLAKMVSNYKLMTFTELIPYFDLGTLSRFCRVSKACNRLMDPNSKSGVNYQVLLETQGIKLTPADVEETKISASRALHVAAKYIMLKSLMRSQRIIGKKAVNLVSGKKSFPSMTKLLEKSWREIRSLTIAQV